jgi:hypothetical protein
MHPHVSVTERVGFLKARRWEPGSPNSDICVRTWNPVHGNSQIRQNSKIHVRTWNPVQPLNFPFSAFCERHLLWTSVGRNYHSYRWPYNCTLFFFQVVIIFVLVLVQIDLIHFEHTKCICSTSIKTNTYPLHLRSIHTILCKIRHVIQIVPDYFVLIQFVLGQFERKLIENTLSLSD